MSFTLPAAAEAEVAVVTWRTMHQPLDRLLMQLPADRALRRFGFSLWQAGHKPAAIQVLTVAAALAPEDAVIWYDLANLLSAGGRPDEAQVVLEMTIARDAAQPQAWLLLATILNGAHKYPDAEHAFRMALEHDPKLAEASFGLGILFFQQRRFEEAIDWLAAAIAAGCNNVGLHVCIGQAQFLLGRFLDAADSFTNAARFEPADKMVRDKIGLLGFIKAVIEGSVDTAITIYRDVMGAAAEDIDQLTYKVFHLLTGHGYREAAVRLGSAWLASAPEDPVRRYLLAAASGEAIDRPPDEYVVAYFNRFADGFDNQLRRVLHYKVPEELHALLAARGQSFGRILDLGCGTGLAAPFLKSFDCKLTGVDLAPLMLAKAKERNVYDELIEAEGVAYLAQFSATFDLVFAADSLIYIGDLRALYAAAAKALVTGGVFAFSIETTDAADCVLQPSGRFAHSRAYIEALAHPDFAVESVTDTTIRLEANRPLRGALVILRRRAAQSRQEQPQVQSQVESTV
jgi:predicted TPR repeat methyltransferase/Flp pilus assembly protein TadD